MDCDGYCPFDAPQVLRYARTMGARTVALAGQAGDELAAAADYALRLPADHAEGAPHLGLVRDLVAALRQRAAAELVPGLILASGRGATPQQPAVRPAIPRRRAILLDRDGVINTNRDDYVKSWEEVELLPGAIEALRALALSPYPIVVVTNQSAVNQNKMSYEMAENINLRLIETVTAHGGRIDAVAWCPHRPDEACDCRKPRPGMLKYLAACLNLDLESSYLVGDAEGDLEAGMAVGCQTALVLTGRGEAQRLRVQVRWGNRCQVLPDLAAAAQWIISDSYAYKQALITRMQKPIEGPSFI
jgi:D-glycero-D-manno-heptose 1,7-bisphosphate phosphatase